MAIFSNRRHCGLHLHHHHNHQHHRREHICKWRTVFSVHDCTDKWASRVAIALVVGIMLIILLCIFQPFQTEVNVIVINTKDLPIHVTDSHYLSVALDASLIVEGFQGFNMSDTYLLNIIKPFRGSYLRIGGTMSDRLIFNPTETTKYKSRLYTLLDGDICAYEEKVCKPLDRPNFTMSATEWTQLNKFANSADLTILFDLNCLLRYPNGTWNSVNAEELIKFSNDMGFDLIWELGNEPNAFRHVFNYEVTPAQLALDFIKLRDILKKYTRYENSMLVGPDVTKPRPHHSSSMDYLENFLRSVKNNIDAITWHQYYFNGREAYLYYFISPDIFNVLQKEIDAVKDAVKNAGHENTPIWLGETSSAYGGGAVSFSDKYISTFIWLDKLGLSAKNGIDVVIRQSLYKGYYALISESLEPNPDWWVSVLFKQIVGTNVIECYTAAPAEVRLYCHCSKKLDYVSGPAIVIYGLNMKNSEATINIQEIDSEKSEKYVISYFVLQTRISVLSRYIFLNDELLIAKDGILPPLTPVNVTSNYFTMPPFSLGFWIVRSNNFKACWL